MSVLSGEGKGACVARPVRREKVILAKDVSRDTRHSQGWFRKRPPGAPTEAGSASMGSDRDSGWPVGTAEQPYRRWWCKGSDARGPGVHVFGPSTTATVAPYTA